MNIEIKTVATIGEILFNVFEEEKKLGGIYD
jgi:hypothetical protein